MTTMMLTIIVIVVPSSSSHPLLYSSPLFSLSFPRNMEILLILGPPFEEALILIPRSVGSTGPPPFPRAVLSLSLSLSLVVVATSGAR